MIIYKENKDDLFNLSCTKELTLYELTSADSIKIINNAKENYFNCSLMPNFFMNNDLQTRMPVKLALDEPSDLCWIDMLNILIIFFQLPARKKQLWGLLSLAVRQANLMILLFILSGVICIII